MAEILRHIRPAWDNFCCTSEWLLAQVAVGVIGSSPRRVPYSGGVTGGVSRECGYIPCDLSKACFTVGVVRGDNPLFWQGGRGWKESQSAGLIGAPAGRGAGRVGLQIHAEGLPSLRA